MRTLTEIRKEKADLEARIASLNAAENGQDLKEALDRHDAVNVELRQAEVAERKEQEDARRKMEGEARKGHDFSLLRFIQGAMKGKMDGIEADYAAIGAEEYSRIGLRQNGFVIPSFALMRASGSGSASGSGAGSGSASSPTGQNATTNADGGNLVITTQRYVEEVREKLVVAKMGATILNGLVGNVDLPSVGGITASFLDEAAQASAKKASVAKVTLTPRGCRAYMVTTRDLLKQTSIDVNRVLIDRLSDAAAACLEKEALASIVSAATQPAGGTSLTWANVVAMETTINTVNANRGNMGYVLPTASWGTAKTTLKASGVAGYILDGNTINGYRADFSNCFAANTPVFGNFADLYLGNWGGIDILVDPYSLGDTGEVKVQLFYYADAKVALAKSFAKLTIS